MGALTGAAWRPVFSFVILNMAHPGGRPLIFETPEQLQAEIDIYIETEDKPTLAGLAYHLGIDRHTLYNYKEREEFFHIVKKATDWVEAHYEARLIYENNPTGVIFALKNMNWKDKQEVDANVTTKVDFRDAE